LSGTVDNRTMRRWQIAALAGALAACSPALDWREVRIGETVVVAIFPCKPDRFERKLELAGNAVTMRLLSCSADDTTFALSQVELADPAAVAPALAALRAAVAANLGASAPQPTAWQPAGATPNAQAARIVLEGRLPDGAAVQGHAVFFAYGRIVLQATVIGGNPAGEAAETFFAGLRVGG
jgi:hypothetical protein